MAQARDNRKAIAVGLAMALCFAALGTVRAQNQLAEDIVTTGHTTWSELSTEYDNCMAGITGALMQRVTWFNGMTLFSRTASGGEEWIYAMELFTDANDDGYDDKTGIELFDPRAETLYETGRAYEFPDENEPDVRWSVVEYYALKASIDLPDHVPGPLPNPNQPIQSQVYVWAVQVGDHAITDFTIGRDYNFVSLVDTCKFKIDSIETVQHKNGEDCGGQNQDLPSCQHNPDDILEGEEGEMHPHGTFAVGLWVGGEPSSIPLGADPGDIEEPDTGGATP